MNRPAERAGPGGIHSRSPSPEQLPRGRQRPGRTEDSTPSGPPEPAPPPSPAIGQTGDRTTGPRPTRTESARIAGDHAKLGTEHRPQAPPPSGATGTNSLQNTDQATRTGSSNHRRRPDELGPEHGAGRPRTVRRRLSVPASCSRRLDGTAPRCSPFRHRRNPEVRGRRRTATSATCHPVRRTHLTIAAATRRARHPLGVAVP
jgi:hypothetical protein